MRKLTRCVPASPYWWYDFTVDGRGFRGSTRTEDRELAELFAIKAGGHCP
jgi:hypothetical protein